ncbi:hypothetical protein N0V93_006165 [Gnomoniopsis smithogilvyi]|uniref:Telomeric single stranded DNA binding POT1/Cdc13 domain-containing protein n=1 Tax=Gnomoniopsis smithogilvyi TaxID=1191159 RepID=A0A9W8YQ87_9PEZI|nr:hypothetical protein N0V93_006165 [Gnomoniopsis smithogilvyi]
MASSDGTVEQLLSSRTATPIAQLHPNLPDQETRTVHGEITITWPYSFVTKTFAFLLAEPDFRLRRNRGQVRIQLQGPSAEAIGKWELGSGDVVTLAMDGVEWAKDEEPARPAGSRSEWQLKFASKLRLKATLGETQETKLVNIDQPIPIAAPEALNPIPFAEIDLTIFDAPIAVEEPPTPPVPVKDDEYASPMFMKRSRAYEPLFELDLDDELEDDGGRKGKGRKRPRYSALNGRWRLNEDNSSPEPEQPEGTPSVALEQNEDVEMQDTPSRPSMADGGVQTNEADLAPIPSSPLKTPSKTWTRADDPLGSDVGVSRPHDVSRTDSGVQASPSRPASSAPTEFQERATAQAAPNPFGQAVQSSGFAAFGLPQEASQTQVFEDAPLAFGTIPGGSSNQGFGGTSSPFGATPHSSANQGLGQTSSLLGTNSAQEQSSSSQMLDVNNGFGAPSGSVRFSFGQEPRIAFAASSSEAPHTPVRFAADPYPESSLGQQDLSNYPLSASHNPVGADIQDSLYSHSVDASVEQTPPKGHTPEQDVPLWPMGARNFDSGHAIDRVYAAEDLGSNSSDPERSWSGMIPPAVDDGTRNLDEMKQEGILSQAIYRQGVPQEALSDQEDAIADEEDESMDSDEQAAYHDSDKGDDYDLRNYDRVSDDEEGFEDEEPLSEQMADGDSEHWAEEEASYDEDEYDEDEDEDEEDNDDSNVYAPVPGHFSQTQLPSQPPAQKDKIVIDLLSDSDDDEPPVPPIKAPRSQVPLHESGRLPKSDSVDFSETESAEQHDHQEGPTGLTLSTDGSAPGVSGDSQDRADYDEAEDFEEEDGQHSDEEHFQDNEDGSEYRSDLAGPDDGGDAEADGAIKVNPAAEPDLPPNSLNGAKDLDDGQKGTQSNEEERSKESDLVHGPSGTDPQPDSDGRDIVMATDDDQAENPAASFQTQPDEVMDSFKPGVAGSSSLEHSPEGYAASGAAMEDDTARDKSHPVGDEEPQHDAFETARGHQSEMDGIDQEPRGNAERSDVDMGTEAVEVLTEEFTTVETQETQGVDLSSIQQDDPLDPPVPQNKPGLTSAVTVVESSETTVTSNAETYLSSQEVIFETQQTELKPQTEGSSNHQSPAEQEDVEMVDAETAVGSKLDRKQADFPQNLLEQGPKHEDISQCLTPMENMHEPPKEEVEPVPVPKVAEDVVPEQTVHDNQRVLTQDGNSPVDEDIDDDDDHDEFHETSEVAEQAQSSLVSRPEDSFASIDSQTSGTHDAEEAETAPEERPKRGGKKARNSSGSKSAKSTPASQKAQRQSSRQSSRQVSSQQAPSSQRTTRSKTMSFQAASPKEDKEDMSIKLARAALKSPTSKKRKVPATPAKNLNTDLVKRLENDLPDCVALNDLRKYNANFVDAAAVATSANVPPKRTPTREYASSFTITDPSVAPNGGVVEVELYSLHKDHLPVVKTGDSVLLRGFLVVSLPGRGFGLKTKDGSSWAVFKAEGDDQPEMKAAPVEMSDKEAKFMLDARAWYADLDETAKGILVGAVQEMVAAGKQSRAKK